MVSRFATQGNATFNHSNDGIGLQVALLSFFVVFAISSTAVLMVARVRKGWNLADRLDEEPPTPEDEFDEPRLGRDVERVGAP